jgi:NADPH2:quinone reductase
MPDPQAGPGQVLIKIQAAGINPMERNLANGAMKATVPATFPSILGSDLSGVVQAVGEGAANFKSGDQVFGHLSIAPRGSAGTYAE